jgi:hypothetical protein
MWSLISLNKIIVPKKKEELERKDQDSFCYTLKNLNFVILNSIREVTLVSLMQII